MGAVAEGQQDRRLHPGGGVGLASRGLARSVDPQMRAFIHVMGRSRVRVAVVTRGDYDLTTPEGRFTARIVGAVARKESEDRQSAGPAQAP